MQDTQLYRLLLETVGERSARILSERVHAPEALLPAKGPHASRSVIAQAFCLVLFDDLLNRVPSGHRYVMDVARERKIVFDHGAVRTVRMDGMGDLPSGESMLTRILRPLGYELRAEYPLPRLKMTGRSYAHQDFPEDIPQFFVSEIHAEKFSLHFRNAAARVFGTSKDPVGPGLSGLLATLEECGELPLENAVRVIQLGKQCFSRNHRMPNLDDYRILLAESAEMAWIATEGNAFNHATDRVTGIDELHGQLKSMGFSIKENVEISKSGRVRQTALAADKIRRDFKLVDGNFVGLDVPGSFYEFIEREAIPGSAEKKLDLGFDASNATGIFKMTDARHSI